jgi:hypothetical protein
MFGIFFGYGEPKAEFPFRKLGFRYKLYPRQLWYKPSLFQIQPHNPIVSTEMAVKLEELFARSIAAWEKNKPLPPLPPPPRRPARLTNFFLPSSPKLPPGSRSWTPPPPSPEAPPSLSGFTLSPKQPGPLSGKPNLQRELPLVSKDIEERMALLVLENNHLRQQNRGLYQQNSGLKKLVREYNECYEEANSTMGNIKAAREAMELII